MGQRSFYRIATVILDSAGAVAMRFRYRKNGTLIASPRDTETLLPLVYVHPSRSSDDLPEQVTSAQMAAYELMLKTRLATPTTA